MSSAYQRGSVLVMVLIVTAVGLLFGAGSLLLFRFQCQLRIDRQHEMEKLYAVRSALNFIRTYTGEITENALPFRYHTNSGRDLGVIIRPVAKIFPDVSKKHYVMKNAAHFSIVPEDRVVCRCEGYDAHYRNDYDYEYGAAGVTNLLLSNIYDNEYGLTFADQEKTNNVSWWVNIGMRKTGGWLEEGYGRRYFFQPVDYVNCNGTNDILRLCLIRNVTNTETRAGCNHGWPLSQEGEMALVFEISPRDGDSRNNAEMAVYEYRYVLNGNGNGAVDKKLLMPVWKNRPSRCYMGLQIAGDRVSMFHIGNEKVNSESGYLYSRGYEFSDVVQMSTNMYYYFRNGRWIGNKWYKGIFTNEITGKVEAPEMRAVFEVERRRCTSVNQTSKNFLTDFSVTPAYQFDVFLEHPSNVSNLATVAQRVGEYSREGYDFTVLTYDTHGTEHKGFRYDERHPNGK